MSSERVAQETVLLREQEAARELTGEEAALHTQTT
jgi:hypothetical protein